MGGGWAKSNDAMTVFEMKMGMIDRGAELTWLSQYPHERECLFPPLTGMEAIGADVDGKLLNFTARLSVNLSAQTLDQVLSRRRKVRPPPTPMPSLVPSSCGRDAAHSHAFPRAIVTWTTWTRRARCRC